MDIRDVKHLNKGGGISVARMVKVIEERSKSSESQLKADKDFNCDKLKKVSNQKHKRIKDKVTSNFIDAKKPKDVEISKKIRHNEIEASSNAVYGSVLGDNYNERVLDEQLTLQMMKNVETSEKPQPCVEDHESEWKRKEEDFNRKIEDLNKVLEKHNIEHERQMAVLKQKLQIISPGSKDGRDLNDKPPKSLPQNATNDVETSQKPLEVQSDEWIEKFERLNQRKREFEEESRLQREEHERQMEILRRRLEQINEQPIKDCEPNEGTSTTFMSHDKIWKNPGNKIDNEEFSSSTLLSNQYEKDSDEEKTLEEQLNRQFQDAELAFELMNELEKMMKNFDQAMKNSQNSHSELLKNEFYEINELKSALNVLHIHDPDIHEEKVKCIEKIDNWLEERIKLVQVKHKCSEDMKFAYIVDICEVSKQISVNYSAVNSTLLHPDVKDRKIVIVSVVDEGLLLDNCLSFMYNNYPSLSKMDGNFSGYTLKSGFKADSKGILLWNDVFLHDSPSGDKVAIIFVSTQGLCETHMSEEVNAKILNLSALISSIKVFKHQTLTNENKKVLRKTFSNFNGKKKSSRAPNGIETYHIEMRNKHLSSPDKSRHESPNKINCTLHIYSSESIELIDWILNPENLVIKSIFGRDLTCVEYRSLLLAYLHEFEGTKRLQVNKINQLTSANFFYTIINEQLKVYQSQMSKLNFDCSNDEALNANHEKIKNEAIDNFMNAVKEGRPDYIARYKLHLEKEVEAHFRILKKPLLLMDGKTKN